MSITVIISENREGGAALQALRDDLLARLTQWPEVEVKVVPYLYDLDPEGPGMNFLRSIEGDMVVLASFFARTSYWLLHANEVRGRFEPSTPDGPEDDDPQRAIWCIDLRGQQTEPLLAELERIVAESTGKPPTPLPQEKSPAGDVRLGEITRLRWYPIIDFSRCENCLECLNFCLFGVFGIDGDGRLFLEQPDACRDGCPACARVCPSQAIMFPQHDNPGIAGDPNAKAADMNVSLVQLLGSVPSGDLAATERDRALAEKAKEQSATPSKTDDLDAMVDELDRADL